MPKKPLRDDVLALSILSLLIVACFADVLFAGSCFFVRDLTRYYFPSKSVIHRIVASGELPLWNPYYSGGQPALANPEYEVFYPGQWLIFLPDFITGFRLHILLHFFIGAAGMYALIRSMTGRADAALITAIVFVLSGPFLSATNLLTTLFPLAWFPWTLLFVRRYLRERGRRDLVLGALCAAMILLVFEPGNALQIGIISAAYALYHGRRSGEGWRAAARVAAPFGLAVAVAAVQILPTLDFVRRTTRSHGMAYDMIATWSMPPVRLLEFLQPHFLGHSPFLSNDYWGAAQYGAQGAPYFHSLYLGLLPLIALIAGLVQRNRKTTIGVSSAAVVLVIAFGDHTPLLRMASRAHLPLVLRFPERFVTGAAFVPIVCAGVAIARVLSDDDCRRTALRVAIVVGAAVMLVTALTFAPSFSAFFSAIWGAAPEAGARWTVLARGDWLATLGRAALLCAILAIVRQGNRFRSVLLVLFVIVDLVPLVNEIAPRAPREFFQPPAVMAELHAASASRIFFQPEWSNGAIMKRYYRNHRTVYWIIRNGMFPRLPATWGFATILERDIDLTNLLPSAELLDAFWRKPPLRPEMLAPYAAIANIEWLAALRPPEPALRDPSLVRPITFVRLPPSPRYYFADEVVRIRSNDDFVDQLTSGRHSRHAAYTQQGGVSAGTASVVRFTEKATRIGIETTGRAAALLVASVTRDPYWHATVDGVPASIIPVNIAFQAIAVPPGRHHVELRYSNPFVLPGILITVITLIAMLAFLRFAGDVPPGRPSERDLQGVD